MLVPVLGMSLIGGWVLASPGMLGGRGMMGYGTGAGALALLVLVASIAGIVFLLTRGQPEADDRQESLKHRRLARGEITRKAV